jgi:hypothetical protein
VFADQVDASGRAEDPRAIAEEVLKALSKFRAFISVSGNLVFSPGNAEGHSV